MPNVHNIVFVFQDCRLIVVHVEVVGCTEDGHNTREASRPRLPVHAIASILSFMGPDDGEQVVLLEERACSRVREEIRAAANVVMYEKVVRLFLSKLFKRVGPEDVAHQTMRGWLPEAIDLMHVSSCSDHDELNEDVTYALEIF